MTGSTAPDALGPSGSLPACPRCGTPVALVTNAEPAIDRAAPCGCRLVPGTLGP